MKRVLSALLPLAGVVLFMVIVQRTGVSQILDVFRSARPAGIAASIVVLAAVILVRGIRWRFVLRRVGVGYSLRRAISVWTIGFGASAVTPGKVGDLLRAVYVRADSGRDFGTAFLTVFVDRVWDLGFALVAGMVSVVLFSQRYFALPSGVLVLISAAVLGVGIFVLIRRDVMRFLFAPLFRLLVPAKHQDNLSMNFHAFYDAMRSYGSGVGPNMVMATYTLLCWGLIYLLAWTITWALAIPVSFKYMMLIMPIITIVELVPVSVAGLGTRDATVIYFFSVIGIGNAPAVGFSVAYLLIGTWLTALVGFALWTRNPARLGTGQ